MQTGDFGLYNSYALDYSFMKEFVGTTVYRDFFMRVSDGDCDIYVSKDFKLLHQCITHQADDISDILSSSLRDLFSILLNYRKVHQIDTVSSRSFLREVSKIDGVCLLTSRTGILFKRMYDQKLEFNMPICVVSEESIEFYKNSAECYENVREIKISPLAAKTEYLDAHVFCNVGDVVQTASQKSILLSTRISNGAEGMIFKTNDPRIVAKIYHKGNITPLRWSKLSKMVARGINAVEICWPVDLLFYQGVPVGYTMRLGKGSTLSNILDGPDAVTNAFPDWKRVDVVDTLINLLEKFLYLHMNDIIIGDIQLKNALLYSSASCYLIDMDSCQIGNLPCPVGTEEFTPTELWGRNFVSFLRTLKHEDYCIAMLVFSVLFCGLHPYARRNGKETLREEILERNFPYKMDNSGTEFIPLGGYEHIWAYLPDKLRSMLYDVFALGINHETIEWYSAVLDYKDDLINERFEDPESYKVFPKMDYHKTPDAVPVMVKGRTGFKDSIIYNGVNNPFAAAANSSFDTDTSGLVATNKPFYATRNNRNDQADDTVKGDDNDRGGRFPFFGKRKY